LGVSPVLRGLLSCKQASCSFEPACLGSLAGRGMLPSLEHKYMEYSAIICSELSGSHVEASISSDRGKCAKCMWPVMS